MPMITVTVRGKSSSTDFLYVSEKSGDQMPRAIKKSNGALSVAHRNLSLPRKSHLIVAAPSPKVSCLPLGLTFVPKKLYPKSKKIRRRSTINSKSWISLL